MSTYDRRRSLEEMTVVAGRVDRELKQQRAEDRAKRAFRWWAAGSFRRARFGEEGTVGDLDLLMTSMNPNDSLRGAPMVESPATHGARTSRKIVANDGDWVMLDVFWCPWDAVGPMALFLTGPQEFNVWMRQTTARAGLMLSQYGLFERVPAPTRMKPDRVRRGARLDRSLGGPLALAEQEFWEQWAFAVGLGDVPLPGPHERRMSMVAKTIGGR